MKTIELVDCPKDSALGKSIYVASPSSIASRGEMKVVVKNEDKNSGGTAGLLGFLGSLLFLLYSVSKCS